MAKYRSLAAVTDTSTGDKRRLAEGVVSGAPTPMPIAWTREDVGGHTGAVTIGAIDGLEMEGPNQIWADWHPLAADRETMPRLAEDIDELMLLVKEGVVGLSIDPDDYEEAIVERGTDTPVTEEQLASNPDIELERLVTKARIRSATFVRIPAFVETNHTTIMTDEDDEAVSEPDDNSVDEGYAVAASVSGATDLPIADRDHAWDGPAAAKRVLDSCSDDDGKIDKACASRAFLWVDGDGTERGDYKLGYADLLDGELTIIPRGVAATAGGRGVRSTKGVDQGAVEGKICTLYGKLQDKYDEWPDCPFGSEEASALTASGERIYAEDAFDPPVPVTGPMPITYDSERGMVYGHIYESGTCHGGFPNECRMPPVEEDFSRFHVHPVPTDGGTRRVGRLTAGGDHPPRTFSLPQVQRAHDVKTLVAYVVARVDKFGIFICGPMERGLDRETLSIISRRVVSGHWPVVTDDGDIALAEVLALRNSGDAQTSEPAFPITAYRDKEFCGLTAALGPKAPEQPAVTAGAVMTADLFRETAKRLVLEELDKAQAAGFARAELEATMGADIARRRDELAKMIGV